MKILINNSQINIFQNDNTLEKKFRITNEILKTYIAHGINNQEFTIKIR